VELEIKNIDDQGRIMLPKNWRKRYLKSKKAVISQKGDLIEIRPFEDIDLTKYFDSIKVDLEASLDDWHKVREELRRK